MILSTNLFSSLYNWSHPSFGILKSIIRKYDTFALDLTGYFGWLGSSTVIVPQKQMAYPSLLFDPHTQPPSPLLYLQNDDENNKNAHPNINETYQYQRSNVRQILFTFANVSYGFFFTSTRSTTTTNHQQEPPPPPRKRRTPRTPRRRTATTLPRRRMARSAPPLERLLRQQH
jgi:hypothetical protein